MRNSDLNNTTNTSSDFPALKVTICVTLVMRQSHHSVVTWQYHSSIALLQDKSCVLLPGRAGPAAHSVPTQHYFWMWPVTVDKGSQPLLLGHKDDPHSGLEIKKGGVLYKLQGFATNRKETKLSNKMRREIDLWCANTFHLTTASLTDWFFNELLVIFSNILQSGQVLPCHFCSFSPSSVSIGNLLFK